MIADALAGRPGLGGGATLLDPDFLYFHRGAASVPSAADGLWGYAQMVRWGQIAATAAAERSAAGVFRADLFRRCLGEDATETRAPLPFDGVAFAIDDVASYLARFDLQTPFAEFRPL
jgi:NitT/TauT family transport system ATP-binding protein